MTDEIPLWKQKFPNASHAPDPKCKRCKGQGFYIQKAIVNEHVSIPEHETCCICIFVDHDFADEAAKILSGVAKKELKKLRRNK